MVMVTEKTEGAFELSVVGTAGPKPGFSPPVPVPPLPNTGD